MNRIVLSTSIVDAEGFPGFTFNVTTHYNDDGSVRAVKHDRLNANIGAKWVKIDRQPKKLESHRDNEYVWVPSVIIGENGKLGYWSGDGEIDTNHVISQRLVEIANGEPPSIERYINLARDLSEKGAWAAMDDDENRTFIVINRGLFGIGCSEAWDVLISNGIIDEDGNFDPEAKLSQDFICEYEGQLERIMSKL